MLTGKNGSRERHLACVAPLWAALRALRCGAHAIRELHDDQVYLWERFYRAGRVPVRHAGPLTWIPALDGYRLTGSYLPATAYDDHDGHCG